MVFLVRVQVNVETLKQFAVALQGGLLDNTHVRGETWCLKDAPAVGYSFWETADRADFDRRFDPWRKYYSGVEISEVVSPKEAMMALFGQLGSM
jgi:hypothetical protein